MKGTFDFAPSDCDYGAATPAIRQLIAEWQAVDWFEPAAVEPARAIRLFEDHNALCHSVLPGVFAPRVAVRTELGGWSALAALRARVQEGSRWDWKFSGLKPMTKAHSKARGWSLGDAARAIPADQALRPGALFFHAGHLADTQDLAGDGVIWRNVGPTLDLRATLPNDAADIARWYLHYAFIDLCDAVEWQLAEASPSLEGNPLVPLLRCYGAGYYPFSLGPTEVILFAFESGRTSLYRTD